LNNKAFDNVSTLKDQWYIPPTATF